MAEIKWIKITTDIFSDEKIMLVEQMPDADTLLVIWFKLLCKSKLKNRQGTYVYKIPPITLTNEVLQTVLNYKQDDIGKKLKTLEEHGFIVRTPKEILIIPFWSDRHDRSSARYKDWRNDVFERDNYTCQSCGTKKNLQAHHIIAWKDTEDNPELRYTTENGIALCRACHLEAHGGRWS